MKKMKKIDITNYSFYVEKKYFEDNYFEYVVRIAQFPDIIGAGLSVEEAIRDARINLQLYFDYCTDNNIDIPDPAENEIFKEYSGKLSLRIPKALHRDLSEYANRDGVSINSIVSDSIRLYLNKVSIKELIDEAERKLIESFDGPILSNDINNWSFWDKKAYLNMYTNNKVH